MKHTDSEKLIEMEARDIAEVYLFLEAANAFLHGERNLDQLNAFQDEYYPVLKNLYYNRMDRYVERDILEFRDENYPDHDELDFGEQVEILLKCL